MLNEKKLKTKMDDLDIAPQTLNRLKKHKIESVSDFMLYDCKDNTKCISYGISRFRISRNGRNRIYNSLNQLEVPRAFEVNENKKELKMHTEIFDLPISYGTINKLYRMNFVDWEDCLKMSLLTKKCLGNEGFMEVKKLANINNYKLEVTVPPLETRIIDFDNPQNFNVIENGKIKWVRADGGKIGPWAEHIEKQGFETIQDIADYGYNLFLLEYGETIKPYLMEYGIHLNEKHDSKIVAELKEAREMISMLLESSKKPNEDKEKIENYVKSKIKPFQK